MALSYSSLLVLTGSKSSVVIDCQLGAPQVVYWRKKLNQVISPKMTSLLRQRQEAPASPMNEVPLTLSPTQGQGFTGHPGLSVSGNGDQWSLAPTIRNIVQHNDHHYTIVSLDIDRQIELEHTIVLDPATDVLSISSKVSNLHKNPITIHACAAATLPIASPFGHIIGFEGHWAGEFHTHEQDLHFGAYARENRRGRTSHDAFPGLIMRSKATTELVGEAFGFHLGWSGNHKILAEKMADGRAYVQLGELLLPGEIQLQHGESYSSPVLYACYSDQGLSGLSQQYHRYVRQHLIRTEVKNKPRPVHYNTWEGIYFKHDMTTLKELAERASNLGAERFVLDDGWFTDRNDDTAALGDWYVDHAFYPDGLGPLIDHVKAQGLEFGLWFEPEMVNPNSNLFRAHPDWVLSCEGNAQLGFRNQLVLDLTRTEVFNYLFERLDSLLSEYDISYVKWDMNRDINHPGDAKGKPAIHRQTQAFYQLVAALKANHPSVEIESCASGGGRADFGVLAHTDRIWTSDSNDALERLKIQKGFSYFFPPELMGSHVGPRDCHITHRHLSMEMRASVTLFGHMGMEMDLRELTDSEQIELRAMTALYKQHRNLVHSGDLFRLELPAYMHGLGIVAENKSHALFSYSLIECPPYTLPEQYLFAGLKAENHYKLDVIWPLKLSDNWPKSALFNFKTNLPDIDGQVFSGELLMQLGLQLPLLTPQSSLIFQLTAM
ncbi:MAG: alpha-galactosidase [Paraglaciecola sp.]|uniref:alpha-galactosidase n=1 Tax=Paraglaciecola sp. TaxID=1920173 RepID=UPI00273EA523|nr:alpha-galactosidase [Paraglaciecola sp.]MDP5029751.1 alpha-galactosidase [Paraglaciecola sp.]MDP5131632.1 alpha-galactosidase [Paraglaciecola sp.]